MAACVCRLIGCDASPRWRASVEKNQEGKTRFGTLAVVEDVAIPAEAIRSELEKILGSRTFRSAQSQSRFLRYAVEETIAGRGHMVKEYVIGAEVFGRGASFDPRLDPIVRTEARKLRARLDKYYEGEAQCTVEDPVRIEFHKGSYVPTFSRVVPTAAQPTSAVAIEVAGRETSSTAGTILPAVTPPRRSWRLVALPIAIFILASAGYYLFRSGSAARLPPTGNFSIAVIPFVNLGDNNEDEFLGDGLAEELIDALQQVPGLQVVGRASSFGFKSKPLDVQQIGRQLHVGTVVVGSVRRIGGRLRITAQLDSTANNYHLWSGSYDRDSKDARTIQWEIAESVTNVLGIGLARNEQEVSRTLSNSASPNPGAWQNYLKGLYVWHKLTVDSLQMATSFFQEAIAEDPSFARAYTALADCYVMAPQVASTPALEVIAKIKAAASKALQLDGNLGEAHIDLAVAAEYEYDWSTAQKEFERGLKLSPSDSVGHLWYAKYLALVGRVNEVIVQRRIAAEVDPASPYAVQAIAGYLSVAGRYNEAIDQFQNALRLEPGFGLAHQGLGVAYVLKGMYPDAVAELQTASRLMAGPRRMALLGWGYGVMGKTSDARRILNDFLDQDRRGPFPALAIAQVYIGLGDKDRAFHWLDKAVGQRDLDLLLQYDSPYAPLRSDPRFAGLLHRMKLL
jgi:TolB-like protein/Tfp pilus assembly protein PilF